MKKTWTISNDRQISLSYNEITTDDRREIENFWVEYWLKRGKANYNLNYLKLDRLLTCFIFRNDGVVNISGDHPLFCFPSIIVQLINYFLCFCETWVLEVKKHTL